MFSKIFSGHSFYHACRYIVNKPGAEVLEYEGVRGHDYRLMADDFIMQQQLRPQKEKACFHCSLSFYPGEVLSNETMVKIAKEYLEKLNITETQFAITKQWFALLFVHLFYQSLKGLYHRVLQKPVAVHTSTGHPVASSFFLYWS